MAATRTLAISRITQTIRASFDAILHVIEETLQSDASAMIEKKPHVKRLIKKEQHCQVRETTHPRLTKMKTVLTKSGKRYSAMSLLSTAGRSIGYKPRYAYLKAKSSYGMVTARCRMIQVVSVDAKPSTGEGITKHAAKEAAAENILERLLTDGVVKESMYLKNAKKSR